MHIFVRMVPSTRYTTHTHTYIRTRYIYTLNEIYTMYDLTYIYRHMRENGAEHALNYTHPPTHIHTTYIY